MLGNSDYILIIEDSKAETHLLLQTLKMHNFPARVRVIHSGQNALKELKSLRENLPGMILLDLRLPDIDGIEILHELKENPKTQDIPVIIRTGSHDPRDKKRCMELGVMDYMYKSMEFESVEQQVLSLNQHWDSFPGKD